MTPRYKAQHPPRSGGCCFSLSDSNELLSLVRNRVAQQGGSWQQMREELYPLYKGVIPADIDGDVNRRNRYLDQDLVAKYVEEKLLSDEASIRALVEEDRSLGQRILGVLDRILAKFGVKPSQERIFVQKARDAYRRALLESRSSQESTDMRQAMEQAYNAGDDAAGDALFEQTWSRPGYTDAVLEEGERLGEKWSIGKGNNRSRQNVRNRVKLSAQEYVQIQSARMAKYHTYHTEMRDVDYVFAHDKFYLIENYGESDFGVMKRLDPGNEFQKRKIEIVMEVIDGSENGRSFAAVMRSVNDLRKNNSRWDEGNRYDAGYLRTGRGASQLDGRIEEAAHGGSGVAEGSGNHGVKEKFSISEPQQGQEPEIPSFHDLIMQQYYEHIGLKPETDTKANTGRGLEEGERFSISQNIQGQNGDYGPGVILDTNIFDGVSPRNWGKVLGEYVYTQLAGKELPMHDAEGNVESVYLAGVTDRVKKDGAKNSHKVIDKLARYRGDNIRALATVHISEALATSEYKNSTDDHSHQWMDENGWEIRKTYLQDKSGTIYEAVLDIANGRDRRTLYDINHIEAIDKKELPTAKLPSTDQGRGQHINRSSTSMVAETGNEVKEKFSVTEPQQGQEAEIPSFHDLIMQQYYEHIGLKPETDTDTKYSVEDGQGQPAEVLPGEDIIGKLPKKAEAALKRAERVLVNRLAKNLSVPFYGNREFLQPITREITTEYLQTGQVSQEKVAALFERAYEEGLFFI